MKEQSLPTLGEFIIEKQMDFKYSSGEFSRLISCIQIASKMVNRFINKAGITNVLGEAGNRNVQGEEQQKLDVIANEIFINALSQREVVCGVASEENDDFIEIRSGANAELSKYVVLMDPPYHSRRHPRAAGGLPAKGDEPSGRWIHHLRLVHHAGLHHR